MIDGDNRLDLNFTEPQRYTLNCRYTLNGTRLTYTFNRGKDRITVLLVRD